MRAQLLIEATPRDSAAVLAILPGGEATELPAHRSSRLTGGLIPGPEGATVRYEGMVVSRGVDVPPVLQFLLDTGAGVSAILITEWLVGRFRGKTERITVNRREINLDEAGQVRRIVEEEIAREPQDS